MTTIARGHCRRRANLPISTVRAMSFCRAAGRQLTTGGHTEATIDLVTLAGFKPAGVLWN